MSKKIVATELVEERANCNFDKAELHALLNPDEEENKMIEWYENDRDSDPVLKPTHKFYEQTREEIQLGMMKKLNHNYFKSEESRQKYFHARPTSSYIWSYAHQGQPMINLHQTMFATTVEQFGTEQ